MTTKVLGIINNPDKEESNKIVLNSLNEEKAKNNHVNYIAEVVNIATKEHYFIVDDGFKKSLDIGSNVIEANKPDIDSLLASKANISDLEALASKEELNNYSLKSEAVTLSKYNSEVLIPLTSDLVWSVGDTEKSDASKHFTDLGSAIDEALKYRQTANYTINLHLTSDIVTTSQLQYRGINLSYLTIHGGRTADNTGFKITGNLNHYQSIFKFDASSSPYFIGITFKGGWQPDTTPRPNTFGGGRMNDGITVINGSQLITNDCRFENFNNAIFIQYNSKASFYGTITSIENCYIGIDAENNSDVVAQRVTISNARTAAKSLALSRVFLYEPNISKCKLGLSVVFGGQMTLYSPKFAASSDATNKNTQDANTPFNTMHNQGLIFKN